MAETEAFCGGHQSVQSLNFRSKEVQEDNFSCFRIFFSPHIQVVTLIKALVQSGNVKLLVS